MECRLFQNILHLILIYTLYIFRWHDMHYPPLILIWPTERYCEKLWWILLCVCVCVSCTPALQIPNTKPTYCWRNTIAYYRQRLIVVFIVFIVLDCLECTTKDRVVQYFCISVTVDYDSTYALFITSTSQAIWYAPNNIMHNIRLILFWGWHEGVGCIVIWYIILFCFPYGIIFDGSVLVGGAYRYVHPVLLLFIITTRWNPTIYVSTSSHTGWKLILLYYRASFLCWSKKLYIT